MTLPISDREDADLMYYQNGLLKTENERLRKAAQHAAEWLRDDPSISISREVIAHMLDIALNGSQTETPESEGE